MTNRHRSGALGLVAVLAVAAGGCVINVDADPVVVREDKRFAMKSGGEVTLDTFDGSISVESWDRPEVSVEIQKRGPDRETAAALDVRATEEGNHVRVEAPPPRVTREFIGIGNVSGPSVSFVVRVPAATKLTAVTRDGSIEVRKVSGTIVLTSGDGSIRAEGVSGDIKARTDDGSLELTDVNGRVSLESGDGSIRVGGRMEDLQARTGDGSIVVEAAAGSTMTRNWDVSTADGSITFRVPRGFDAEINGDSRDGRVQTELEGLSATRDEDGRGTLRGRLGRGGHTVMLRSGDGAISVGGR